MENKYVNVDEFSCPCCGENNISKELVSKLNMARTISDIPFIITSGYRCTKHNAEVGGSPTSSHIVGLAADIKCSGSVERYKIINGLLMYGINRIGIASNFIHCDIDYHKDSNVIWTYS